MKFRKTKKVGKFEVKKGSNEQKCRSCRDLSTLPLKDKFIQEYILNRRVFHKNSIAVLLDALIGYEINKKHCTC